MARKALNMPAFGQSKITLSYKNVEAGVSTENMWWGPGTQNSIMMSNSAPGFLHWTFNSISPVKTVIGSFEWQLIGGTLKQSGYLPYDQGKLIYIDDYIPKPEIDRYISAFTFNWHPKWVNGLFIGVSAYDYLDKGAAYNQKSAFKKYFTVFAPSSIQSNVSTNGAVGDGQDFAYAANLRQVLPQYNAEFYIEYARNDAALSLRDFFLQPDHSSAYTIGGSRFFVVKKNEFLKVAFELTHLQDPDTFLLRGTPSWYVHLISPRDGYTNKGRYVGAGIGPGSNSLMIDLSFIKNNDSFGMKLERYVHNNDLYYFAYQGSFNPSSHWVDLSDTFYANFKYKSYIVSAELTPVYNYNYEYAGQYNVFNMHARLSFTYLF